LLDLIMVRTYDHTFFYEVRLLIALYGFLASLYFFLVEKDRDFLTMFLFGMLAQWLLEVLLWQTGARGGDYSLTLFGAQLSGLQATLLRGFSEGGPIGFFGYAFLNAVTTPGQLRRIILTVGLALVFLSGILVGVLAQEHAVTSVRPMMKPGFLGLISITLLITLILTLALGRRAWRHLGLYALGSLVYFVISFEPLHWLGARYVALNYAGGYVEQTGALGYGAMWLSYLIELTASKLHYFILPYAVGMIVTLRPFPKDTTRHDVRPVLDVNGKNVRYEDTGDGEINIVFLHGWLMNPSIWDQCMPFSRQIRCIRLYQPAHGSASLDPGADMAAWVRWLDGVLTALNAKPCILVGHSMGGMLSLNYYAAHARTVRGLVLMSTQDTAWDDATNNQARRLAGIIEQNWSSAAENVAKAFLGPAFVKQNRAWVNHWREWLCELDFSALAALQETIVSRPDLGNLCLGISAPVLIVHGEDDTLIPLSVARTMAERIGGAKLAIVPRSAHCPSLDAPEYIKKELCSFIQDLTVD